MCRCSVHGLAQRAQHLRVVLGVLFAVRLELVAAARGGGGLVGLAVVELAPAFAATAAAVVVVITHRARLAAGERLLVRVGPAAVEAEIVGLDLGGLAGHLIRLAVAHGQLQWPARAPGTGSPTQYCRLLLYRARSQSIILATR